MAAPLVLWLPAPCITSAVGSAKPQDRAVGLATETEYLIGADTELASAARQALRCAPDLPCGQRFAK